MKSREYNVNFSWVLVLLPVFLFSNNLLLATIRNVPAQYSTIQSAIDISVNQDTILVERGIYFEAIRFRDPNIVLTSNYIFSEDTMDIWETIIDASPFISADTGACATFTRANTNDCKLIGFVLQNGSGTIYTDLPDTVKAGGGVYCHNASPTILWNIFRRDSSVGGAINVQVGHPLISHNILYDNWCVRDLLCLFNGNDFLSDPLVFEWNEIRQNRGYFGAVVGFGQCHCSFRFNWFHDFSYPALEPVSIQSSHTSEFIGNIFENITRIEGGEGLFIIFDSTVNLIQDNVIRNCILSNNAAMYFQRPNISQPQEISRNLFQNLTQPSHGDALGLFITHPNVNIHDNTFENFTGGSEGAIYLSVGADGCHATITRNIFRNNHGFRDVGGYWSGGIMANYSGACIDIEQNWFEDNSPYALRQLGTEVPWDVSNNYWGDASGPYHPIENPNGLGDTVDVSCHVTPWLTEPPALDANPQPRSEAIPENWTLEKIYPNPFNSSVNIKLTSPKTVSLQVTIYDITGRKVKDLWQGVVPAQGNVALSWDAQGDGGLVSSGVYLITAYSQKNSARIQTQKAVLLK